MSKKITQNKTGGDVIPCQKEDILGVLIQGHAKVLESLNTIQSEITDMKVSLGQMNTTMTEVIVEKVKSHDREITEIKKDIADLKGFKIKLVAYATAGVFFGNIIFSFFKDKF
jgi:hypothetical protein